MDDAFFDDGDRGLVGVEANGLLGRPFAAFAVHRSTGTERRVVLGFLRQASTRLGLYRVGDPLDIDRGDDGRFL